ncbi:MAG: O-succinylbenzoic acid--CoA ligase [uncultured Frankineae bacterium]|uniref:O-succinylbenzoic acid--CoA ligase n=1 Tax=uncultured Frankineae bacterium TaxID=437475 RepID=A0A6J4KGC5_9ACTN|nr:MAG: O-succinylbenzoic acid--CoA ligase [uncultured Frankineae bacterium]
MPPGGRALRPVPARAADLLPALETALDGTGPAVVPEVPGLAALRPEEPLEHDDTALVVPTSGSTGEPKGVLLPAAALRASAAATAARIGTGQWLLALPATHIGGLQVLVRSLLAGTRPQVLTGSPFGSAAFAEATARLTGPHRYVSLVPTQLRRLLDPAGLEALRAYDCVLLGGAAAPPPLLAQVRAAGVRVVTTYGASETSGGCVYDGVPLDGVRVGLRDGRITLSGPVVARGYRLRPDLTAAAFDGDTFTTSDLGRVDGGGLRVLGRADDAVVSGGQKVPPAAVEAALASHPAVVEAAVTGLPDPEWGARVVAFVVLRAPLTLAQARDHVAGELPRSWAPREVREVAALPLLPSGKIDRAALR